MTAAAAAEAMTLGVRDALPTAHVMRIPLADGGDGSLDAVISAGFTRRAVSTRGPTGEPIESSFAVRGRTAVVELAGSCGLTLLPGAVPAPLDSSTVGLGDAITAALGCDVDEIVVCLGGSASTDGGVGLLTALGAVARDRAGEPVVPGGRHLGRIATLDLTGLDPRVAGVRFTAATDVTSPLLGPEGAAAVFAPQKGADPDEVRLLEAGLSDWAQVLARATGVDARSVPGAGAAGGTTVAIIAALGGQVTSGARFIAEAVGLDAALDDADVVLTGEGRLDGQSLLGKGVAAVATAAVRRALPVIAICGSVTLTADELARAGVLLAVALDDHAPSGLDAMRDAAELVRITTAGALNGWLRPSGP
jgi:glycerate kinase